MRNRFRRFPVWLIGLIVVLVMGWAGSAQAASVFTPTGQVATHLNAGWTASQSHPGYLVYTVPTAFPAGGDMTLQFSKTAALPQDAVSYGYNAVIPATVGVSQVTDPGGPALSTQGNGNPANEDWIAASSPPYDVTNFFSGGLQLTLNNLQPGQKLYWAFWYSQHEVWWNQIPGPFLDAGDLSNPSKALFVPGEVHIAETAVTPPVTHAGWVPSPSHPGYLRYTVPASFPPVSVYQNCQ